MKFSFWGSEIEGLSFPHVVMRVLIFNTATGTFEQVAEETQQFDEYDVADFFIQEIFSDEKLNYSIANLNSGDFDFIRYKVQYRLEYFDTNNEPQFWPTNWMGTSEMRALPGGTSREFEANYTQYGNTVEDMLNSLAKRWLSNHPTNKRIRKGQYDFLSFLTLDHAAALILRIKVNNSQWDYPFSNNNKIVMVKIDLDQYFDNVNVDEVTAQLLYNGQTIAERKYFLDKRMPATSVFYFRNSFGTLDSLICDGNLIAEREITGDIYQAGRTETPSLKAPDLLSDRKIYDTKYAADIGYHNDSEFQDFITEMMISDDVWRTENGYIFPVVVTTKKYSFIDEKNNNVLRAEITWQRTFTEKYLTRESCVDEALHLSINGESIAITIPIGMNMEKTLIIKSSSNWQLQKLGSETFYSFSQTSGNAGTTSITLTGSGNVTGTAQFKLTNNDGLTVNGTVNKLGKITVDNSNPTTITRTGIKETFQVSIYSDRQFTITKTEGGDWIDILPKSGINTVTANITVELNTDATRTAKYLIQSDYASCTLTITQNKKTVYNLIDNKGNNLIDNKGNNLISY